MSSGKKQQKKRKRHSSPPFISQIGRRLEKLRAKKKDIWADDEEEDDNRRQRKHSKRVISISDSDEERPSISIQRRAHHGKSRKKVHSENATCLICSILSQLSSYNCCSQHLNVLKNPQTAPHWLPDQVMILPVTNELLQHYLEPQQIHQLRKQTKRSSSERNILTPKTSNKSPTTTTPNISELQSSSKKSVTDLPPLASTIVVGDAAIETSSSISIINNNIENTTIIDDHQQENTSVKSTDNNPWIPISDEIDAALEQAIQQIDSSSDTPLEYSPATARRTETGIMASRLPKLSLKEGRFRRGKPTANRTTTDAANEYRPLAAAQSPPPTSSTITIEPPTTDSQIDIVSNSIFTQDQTHHDDNNPTTTTTNEGTVNVSVANETSNEASCVSSSTTNGKTPSRLSYRMNPDGSRVSISRPPLQTNHPSPLVTSLRRTSTDVTPIEPNTKQV